MIQMDGQGVTGAYPVAGNDQAAVLFSLAQPASSVAAVSIMLPPFWPDEPQLWLT